MTRWLAARCGRWAIGKRELQAVLPYLGAYISGQPIALSKTYLPLIANGSSQ
ncbi:MAG: hypothetical protein U0559_16350 [Anaerolineae bacterium]